MKMNEINPLLCAEITRRLNAASRKEKKGIVQRYMETFGLSRTMIYKIIKEYAWTCGIE